jgi:hypothetical protein
MLDDANSMLKAIGTGIALIALCSAPALSSTVTRLNRRDARQDAYEDGDGKASPESLKAYSAKLPKSLVVASGAAGLAVSIALLIISPHAEGRLLVDSLTTGAWVRRVTTPCCMRARIRSPDTIHSVFSCSSPWP